MGGKPKFFVERRVDEITADHLYPDLLNIVVFGPGEGEAILVQLPDGSLGVVDGCKNPRRDDGSDDPMRRLLRRIEERDGARFRLRFVCLTHPHDDHYAGLGKLLRHYDGRVEQVWCPMQTGDRWAKAYIAHLTVRRDPAGQPDEAVVRGLEEVLRELRRDHTRERPIPRTVHEGMSLLDEQMTRAHLSITGVGPCTDDVNRAQDTLLEDLEAWRQGERKRPRFDPNKASGALLIRWGRAGILLAGDLLRGGEDPNRGWNLARHRILDPVQIVNVAHHASTEAHHPDLWSKMEPQFAIVTPFKYAKPPQPPKPDDIRRYLATGATQVAITSVPHWVVNDPDPANPGPVRHRPLVVRHRRRDKNLVLDKRPVVDETRNAVAVAINHRGAIQHLTLAGDAALYAL